MLSSKNRLDRAYKQAKTITFDASSKFILFSDCHRGDTSFADDFANNANTYFHALKHYYAEGFNYIELGDGDELWEHRYFKTIFDAHKHVYLLMQSFFKNNRLHLLYGNHDMVYKDPKFVAKTLSSYYDPITGKEEALFPNIKIHEAILLKNTDSNQELFLTHGHQADWWNYSCWKLSRFLVRVLWKPLNVIGISNPTSATKNRLELLRIEKRIKNWIVSKNNLLTIVGHTHRPRFPKPHEIPFFNDGCCVFPRSITGIEIENNAISLIKWQIATTENGTLKVVRVLLEGPTKLSDYKQTN
ncbi:metallophosphoesterase [Bizionia sp. KMM 8389]